MAQQTQELERQLIRDLEDVADRFGDADSATDLYRALTNTALYRDTPEEHVALSWTRAEEIVNGLRTLAGRPPLTLAQTGHEGEVKGRAADVLQELGWNWQPLDTGRHDDAHVESHEDPPPEDNPQRRGHEPGYPRFDRTARREGARTGFKHRGG
jgi:hypothetical protein